MATSTPPQSSERTGRFLLMQEGPEGFWAYHPNSLPPEPRLLISPALQGQLDAANQALGRLDGITLLVPDPDQFLYTYVRKEAVPLSANVT